MATEIDNRWNIERIEGLLANGEFESVLAEPVIRWLLDENKRLTRSTASSSDEGEQCPWCKAHPHRDPCCPRCAIARAALSAVPRADGDGFRAGVAACVRIAEKTETALTEKDSDLAIGPAMRSMVERMESLTDSAVVPAPPIAEGRNA